MQQPKVHKAVASNGYDDLLFSMCLNLQRSFILLFTKGFCTVLSGLTRLVISSPLYN